MGVEVFVTAAELAASAAEATAAGAEIASILGALEVAAVAAPAIILGAGIGGAILGKQLWDAYNFPGNPPGLQPPVSGGQSGSQYRVKIRYKLVGGAVQEDFYPIPLTGRIYGIGKGDSFGRARYYISHNTNEQTDILTALDSLIEEAPSIVEIQPATGTDNPGTMPRNFQEKPPQDFPIRVPYPFTLPGESAPTIFTPEVFPSPVIDPDPETKKDPGVIVRIPETGLQIQITPQGGFKSRYSPPLTEPGVAPQSTPTKTPPKVATDPCPCPENKSDLTEVLCRIKALQDGLLFDGYDYTVRSLGQVTSRTVVGVDEGVYYVELNVIPPSIGVKSQYGNGQAPDVYFQGWLSFIADGHQLPRQPIHYLQSGFFAPEGCTGFSYTVTLGGTASCVYSTRKKKAYADHC